jgi:hypothetical protein
MPVDPVWVGALRLALSRLAEIEERHHHAVDRLPVLQRAEGEALDALSRAEAAAPLQYSGCSIDGELAARTALEAAEAETRRGHRIVSSIAAEMDQRRAVLPPLVETARVGLDEWLAVELAKVDAEYAAVVEALMGVAARFVAIADAAGASHVAEPAMRLRVARSLLTSASGTAQVGTMQSMSPPIASPLSEEAGRLRVLLDTARRAADRPTIQQQEAA